MGKNKYIKTPEELWNLFLGYVKHTKSKPFLVKDFVGKDGNTVYREKEKPLTMVGFSNYVCDNTVVSYPDIKAYFDSKNENYKEYFPISSRIKDSIRQDQIEGGMAMLYSQSITARLNNLTERTSTEISGGLNIPKTEDIGNR